MENDPRRALDDALNEPLEERLRRAVAGIDEAAELDAGEEKLAEFDQKIASVANQHRDALHPDEEFEARLNSLTERVNQVQSKRQAVKTQVERQQKADGKIATGMGMGLGIAYTIIGCPIFGFAVGYGIDTMQGTTTMRNNAAFVGIVIGMVAALYMIKRSNERL